MIKKIKLGKYTNLFVNKDKKFKEIGFKINFKMPYSYEDITAFNLLTIILRNSCKAYPTISSVNQKMEELYGLQISFNFSYLNDLEILSISGLTINPSYCEDNELLDKIFNHLHEIIYNPNVKNK